MDRLSLADRVDLAIGRSRAMRGHEVDVEVDDPDAALEHIVGTADYERHYEQPGGGRLAIEVEGGDYCDCDAEAGCTRHHLWSVVLRETWAGYAARMVREAVAAEALPDHTSTTQEPRAGL